MRKKGKWFCCRGRVRGEGRGEKWSILDRLRFRISIQLFFPRWPAHAYCLANLQHSTLKIAIKFNVGPEEKKYGKNMTRVSRRGQIVNYPMSGWGNSIGGFGSAGPVAAAGCPSISSLGEWGRGWLPPYIYRAMVLRSRGPEPSRGWHCSVGTSGIDCVKKILLGHFFMLKPVF